MAAGRKPKRGIDFAGWSVDIFDNDTKIDKLLDAHGWNGFAVYFYLCLRAYGSEGYFYRWSYDDCASTSRKMGGGINSSTVQEAVRYCLQIGLFDIGLFGRWGILTSRGIQRKYWEVVKSRDVRVVVSEYWLLQDGECKGLIKLPLNSESANYPAKNTANSLAGNSNNENFKAGNTNFQGRNSDFQKGNANFAPIKESKVKESKEKKEKKKEIGPAVCFEGFWEAYPKKLRRALAEKAYCDLLLGGAAEGDLVEAAANYAESCAVLGTQERYVKFADNFLNDGTFHDFLPGNYKKPEGEGGRKGKAPEARGIVEGGTDEELVGDDWINCNNHLWDGAVWE